MKKEYTCQICEKKFMRYESQAKLGSIANCSMKCGALYRMKRFLGKNHPLWKGDKASYIAKHQWIRKRKGKAAICEDCGSTYYVQWANISGEHKRDVDDYKELCGKCHCAFDDYTNKSWATKRAKVVLPFQ